MMASQIDSPVNVVSLSEWKSYRLSQLRDGDKVLCKFLQDHREVCGLHAWEFKDGLIYLIYWWLCRRLSAEAKLYFHQYVEFESGGKQ